MKARARGESRAPTSASEPAAAARAAPAAPPAPPALLAATPPASLPSPPLPHRLRTASAAPLAASPVMLRAPS